MEMSLSHQTKSILEKAAILSMQRGKLQVRPEYILEALLGNPSLLPGSFMDRYLEPLRQVVQRVHENEFGAMPPVLNVNDVYYSARALDVIRDATMIAKRSRRTQAGPAHLLAAILAQDSEAARYMDAAGMNRAKMVAELRDSLLQSSSIIVSADSSPLTKAAKNAPDAATLITDLTEAARKGHLSKPYFRDREMAEILSVLGRPEQNNVLLVGAPGVGKTRLVEGIAVASATGGLPPSLSGKHVFDLNVANLLTPSGKQLEDQLVTLLKQIQKKGGAILYIDDIHLLLGGASSGASPELAELLGFVLGKPNFICIGETQPEELADLGALGPAIEQNFHTMRIDPLTPEDTHKVLRRLKDELERRHGVQIGSGTLTAAVLLPHEYLRSRELPQKAVEVLDQACSRFQLKMALAETNSEALKATVDPRIAGKVTPHDVKKIVSAMASISMEELNEKERAKLVDLQPVLNARVLAQPLAAARAAKAIREPQRDPDRPNRPYASMVFAGATGVGKTRLARELADIVFGSSDLLLTIDLADYAHPHTISRLIGVQPGQPGYGIDGVLSTQMLNAPYCVVLFDNVEAAHASILDLLNRIVSDGVIKDTKGRELNFKHALVVVSTCEGAKALDRAQPDEINQARLLEQLGRAIPSTFLRNVDVLVPFFPLRREDARLVVRQMIDGVRYGLSEHRVGLRMFESAYMYLLDTGFDSAGGAAKLEATVDRYIADPVRELLSQNRFAPGDMIDVKLNGGSLAYLKGVPESSKAAS